MLPSLLDNIGTIYEGSKSSLLWLNYIVWVPITTVRLSEKLKYGNRVQLRDNKGRKNRLLNKRMLGHAQFQGMSVLMARKGKF